MGKRKYECKLSKDGLCEHAGNKAFDYGFMRGSANFCRHPREKRFVGNIKKCPKT